MTPQEVARKYIHQTDRSIFLTGKAGTGKTTFLKEIVESTFKNVVVAAPTGIAAINAGGVTLHSLFQLPFGSYLPDDKALTYGEYTDKITTPTTLLSQAKLHSNKRKIIQQIDLLVIDEVSMLRADLLDAIDQVLRSVRRRPYEVFGGVQVLFIGDLLQLPPVVQNSEWQYLREYYPSMYFFDALALREKPPIYVEFDKIYRQTDDRFINLLNTFRDNSVTQEDLEEINQQYNPDFDHRKNPGYIHITTHNRKADSINKQRLEELDSDEYLFPAKVSGDFGDHQYPTEDILNLKKGAQVMFIKNDPSGEGKFYNGKIGRIAFIDQEDIYVEIDGEEEQVKVEAYLWENKRYTLNKDNKEIEEKTIGSFTQYPLKLAWAVTVHKSQGLTFERAILDLSESFAPGQMYVALSRLTSLDGMVLSKPIPPARMFSDPKLTEFISDNQGRRISDNQIREDSYEYFKRFVQKAFSFDALIRDLNDQIKGFRKEPGIRSDYAEWGQQLISDLYPIRDTGIKFQRQVGGILDSGDEDAMEVLKERVEKAREYFNPLLKSFSDRVADLIKELNVKKNAKTFIKELMNLKSTLYRQYLLMKKAYSLVLSSEGDGVPDMDYIRKPESDMEKEILTQPKVTARTQTADITFDMYKKGQSVQDIASERNLVASTILGHLTQFVAHGKLSATEILDSEKLENILTVAKKLDTRLLGEIKQKLGNEYEYGEIKMAMAHLEYQEKINS